jgi:hypothetical protein
MFRFSPFLLLMLSCGSLFLRADPIVIDFEGLNDGDSVTTQFAGVTFSDAAVLTAGISLNELEFPPHSGSNVVYDAGGPMTIAFAAPILSFGGYFTYAEALSLDAFDASSDLVASTSSAFDSNLALSGDPGSSPNEFLEVTFATGISSVTITGDPAGGSFVLDDATITPFGSPATVPEPGTSVPLAVAAIALGAVFRRRREVR